MRHFLGLRGSAAFRISSTDVTPNAVNWSNLLYVDASSPCQEYTEQRILGINQTITLSFSIASFYNATGMFGSQLPPLVRLRVRSYTNSGVDDCGDPYSYGSEFDQDLYDGSSLLISSVSVSSGDYVGFWAFGNGDFWTGANPYVSINIRNQSDGNALLDTIRFEQYAY